MIQPRRLIILLNTRHASVLDWRPGNLDWLGEFAATDDGIKAFSQLLLQHARRPVRVILDSVDEDYRMEVLPHVAGAARSEMLARKLRQVFRNAAFTGAWRQGRESDGRRDDRYLLAAMTDADWLKPWLAAVDQAELALEGITLLAMACQSLLKALRVREPHTLLAYRLGSGLRLSYYQDGLLRFSRLLTGDPSPQAADWAAEEISKTQLYLMGQRILPREARLQVLLLDPGGGLAGAAALLNTDPAFNATSLDLPTLARALRVPDAFLASAPDIAPLAAIAVEPLLLNLAPAALTRRHTDYRWQRTIHLTTLAIGVAGIVFTGVQWLRTLDRQDATRLMHNEQQQLEARYRAITRAFPPAPVGAEQLGQTLALAARIEAGRASPLPAMTLLSGVLDREPAITLKTLRWQDASLGAPATTGASLTAPAVAGERLELEAALGAFDGNYRLAMEQIDGLIERLRKTPGVSDVALRKSPINTESSVALSGNTRGGNAPLPTDFALSLRIREAP
jgi:hypothetical protein